ncbi:unnamed protein product [Brachionus calyciflorus]|uniref:EGF-like domain-containing protein n=1 Tax=Brachionus calyciflorus TaxID=104777 RepID=A0A813MD87_9BILA|nr:unnamed protein product [Brachionus calyciflorus]
MTKIFLIFVLFIHETIYAANFRAIKKPSLINTSPFATNSDLPLSVINNLLEKCSNKTTEECDMCSLCQNDAFCRQKSKKLSSTKLLSNARLTNPQTSLTYLKSQIDFTCYCVPGYTGTYCQIDINECLSMPCSNNATCIDRINSYECKCPSGYTGDNCEININECESSPCNIEGGKCIDLIDGYFCNCNPGFTGPTCAININECASQPCMNNVTCVDLVNGFECNCTNTGYDGLFCENNINDCLNVECKHDSVCIDGINSFKCDCHPGYDGKYCEIDINECLSSPCVYGRCWENSDRQSLVHKLLISNSTNHQSQEYTLEDEHTLEASFELTFNYSNAAGYWCECEPGYTGIYCEIKIDECQSSPCGPNGKCIDLVNGYKCICHNGYTGLTCTENIDECKMYSPCAENTKCIDLKPDYSSLIKSNKYNLDEDILSLDGYYCDCTELNENLFKKNGNRDVLYAGQNCTLKLNACQSLKTKCQHDSLCQSILFNSTEQDIMCLCKPGYTGKYCEYSTVFRMDGTYSIDNKINEPQIEKFNLKFDFKVNFFEKTKYPLIYFEYLNQFLFELVLNKDFIEVKNENLGLSTKLGFLYLQSDESYFSMWNHLEITFEDNFITFSYSVKQMQLSLQRMIDLRKFSKMDNFKPTSFTLGKFYKSLPGDLFESDDESLVMDFEVENFLSDACFRDFSLNSEILFKSLKPDYLNHNFDAQNWKDLSQRVKYGCNLRNHGINNNENQCQSETNAYDEKLNYCANNSTCFNKWFNYECKNCTLPFYGKNCQFESTNLVFMSQNTDLTKSNEALIDINLELIQSHVELQNDMNYFKIEFYLHRFSQLNQKVDSDFKFLTLRQKMQNSLIQNFYHIGLDQDGFLTLEKIQINDQSQNETFRSMWSLKNDKISLNQFNTSYSSLINVKLNENFVQLTVNQSYIARFKFSQNHEYIDEIDKMKFEIENVIFMSNFTNGHNFLINDLAINSLWYHFRNSEPYRIELILLDNKQKYVYKTSDLFRIKNLLLIDKSEFKSDLRLIENLECPSVHFTDDLTLYNLTTTTPIKR